MSLAQNSLPDKLDKSMNYIKAKKLIIKANFIATYAKSIDEYEKYYQEAISLCPDNSQFYSTYASKIYANYLVQAKSLLDKAINLDKKNSLAYYLLALIFSDSNNLNQVFDLNKAIENYKLALEYEKNSDLKFNIYHSYNDVLCLTKNYDTITNNCLMMEKLDNNLTFPKLMDIATDLRDGKNFNGAIKILKNILTLKNMNDNDKYTAYYNLGLCYDALNNCDEAIDWYNKALTLFENEDIRLKQINLFINFKKYDFALKNVKFILSYSSKDTAALLNQYLINILQGQEVKDTDFNKFLTFDRYDIYKIMPATEQLIKIGKNDLALKLLTYCIKINKENIYPHINLAKLYLKQNNLDDYNKTINLVRSADYISRKDKYKFVNSLDLCVSDFFISPSLKHRQSDSL